MSLPLNLANMAPSTHQQTAETLSNARVICSRSPSQEETPLCSVCRVASKDGSTTFTEQSASPSRSGGPFLIGRGSLRRSRRIRRQSPYNVVIDNAAAVTVTEPSTLVDHLPASTEARHQPIRSRPTLPTLKLDTSYIHNNNNTTHSSTDFELAQFLSPVAPAPNPTSASAKFDLLDSDSRQEQHHQQQQHQQQRDLLASVFHQQQPETNHQKPDRTSAYDTFFSALGIDLSTMPLPSEMNNGSSLLHKDENDISQYLNDFFSTLPSAPATVPAVPTSVPMSNAFHSLSPVESTYATPFAFDDLPPADTPALVPDDDMLSALTSPMWSDLSLFPAMMPSMAPTPVEQPVQTISPVELSKPLFSFDDETEEQLVSLIKEAAATAVVTPAQPTKQAQREMSGSPAFDLDLSSDAFVVPAIPVPAPASSSSGGKRKRSSVTPSASSEPSTSSKRASFTGSRNTAIPLLDPTAPTQKRVYHGPPSKTSKRAIPASAARKVASLQQIAANGTVEAEEVEAEIERSIEEKRRQNTVAARRSRMRKAEHLACLEEQVRTMQEMMERCREEMEIWKERALQTGWRE